MHAFLKHYLSEPVTRYLAFKISNFEQFFPCGFPRLHFQDFQCRAICNFAPQSTLSQHGVLIRDRCITSKYLLLCIDRFSKFPSTKVENNISSSSILAFMTDYCHLHGFPKSIRADHGSCFHFNDFRNFCEKNNIKLFLCTVGDHRYNGVVERLIYTVKAKLLAMSFNDPKLSLNTAIDKIIWNIRSTKQSSIGCSSFSKHFRRFNTFWKSLVVSHAISLDKGKSKLSKDRSQDWRADDAFEDGYLENTVRDKRGYESDLSDKLDRNFQRASLSNPFSQGGNWFRKTVNRREGEPYFKPLGGKTIVGYETYG